MPLSMNEQKNIVADELVKLVADYAEKFSHPEIPSGEASGVSRCGPLVTVACPVALVAG